MTPREPGALERLRVIEREESARLAGRASNGDVASGPSGGSAGKRSVVAGVVAGLLLFLSKGKALLLLLATKGGLLLSALQLGKLGTTLATMGLSFVYYAGIYPWTFALGLLLLILVHEMGHGFAAKRLGLRVGAPIFIPGFGALISLKDQPRSTWMNAVVGYGGPLAGTIGGCLVLVWGLPSGASHDPGFWTALAHFTFLLNFFNLLPVGGLDGDRITEPLTVAQWVGGLAVVAAVTLLSLWEHPATQEGTDPQVIFALMILVLGIVKAVRVHRRSTRAAEGDRGRLVDQLTGPVSAYTEEHEVTAAQRHTAAIAYFGLVAVLAILMMLSQPPPR